MERKRYRGGGRPEKSRASAEKKESLDLNPEGLKNLGLLLEKVTTYFESKLGIGIDKNSEVSMDWFSETGYYTEEEVERDKRDVAKLEEKFAHSDASKNPDHQKINEIAETFEKAVSVIFHYALKAKGLSIIPTARHTDIFDGVDSFIIDEDTGQVICAIDETTSNRDNIIRGSKLDNTIKRNKEKKIIKYGIALNKENKKWYPHEIKREDAPLAYLSIPREEVVQFIEKLAKTDVDYDEDVEVLCDDLFEKLINSLYQSLHHVMTNMPEQREKMNDLINLIQQKTQLDPSLSDLL